MSAVEFREASGADWTHVAGLLAGAGLPVAGAADHLSHFVLAFSAGTLVACAGMEVYGEYGLLRSVAVAGSERGKGLGAAVVARVLDRARIEGVREVILLTETAPHYFPRFGFEPIMRADVPDASRCRSSSPARAARRPPRCASGCRKRIASSEVADLIFPRGLRNIAR